MALTAAQNAKFQQVAGALQANPADLYALIQFESRWNPKIKNPGSSARGLIQFMDRTAQGMGYSGSLDLVNQNPTIEKQLNEVYRYLKPYAPFPTPQSLFMAVFYPVARTWSLNTAFPAHVQAANPGISVVGDYVNKVYGVRNRAITAFKTRPLWVDALVVGTIVIGGIQYYRSRNTQKA